MIKILFFAAAFAAALVGCGGGGGGGSSPSAPAPVQQLVGEIIATPAQIGTSELATNAGYAGNLPASYAIQAAGKEPMLDFLFMLNGAGTTGRDHNKLADDAEANLAQYIRDNASLLTPGVRLLVLDEVFWNPADERDTPEVLQPQLDALAAAITMVRRYVPQAKVGITVSPYAVTPQRPNTLEYVKRAIALADFVGTDPYWFGDPAMAQQLIDWSRTFNGIAKQAKPTVETWFIAQAFKYPAWDTAAFNALISEQLRSAEEYDHILFFGWQHTSELDSSAAGVNFPAETKQLYSKYLKPK